MAEARKTVADVLTAAQRLGTLGSRPIDEVIEHARQFVAALIEISGPVLDIGTGAGVPGLVIANDRPDLRLTLVDRRATRMDALAVGVAALGWTDRVTVLTADVESLGRNAEHRGNYAAVVSRGFGPPELTARLARPFLRPGGLLVVSEPPVEEAERWPAGLLEETGFGAPRRSPGVVILTAI